MKTLPSTLGFVAVAALIGVLEWQSAGESATNELVISESQRAFVREQVLQSGVQGQGSASYEQALANYIDEEILYREGLKLGLDKDDLIVKRRVVQKMRFLLEDMTPIAPPTPEQLQTWLEQNPQRYQTAQTIVFEHHFFSRGKRGDDAIFQARSAREAILNNKDIQSDPFPLQATDQAVSRERVVKEMGSPAANVLFELPEQEWSEPIQSAMGVHLFKVIERQPGTTMTVDQAGAQLHTDLIAAQRESVNEAGLAALRASYTIKESQ